MAVDLGGGVEGSEDGVSVRWRFQNEGVRVGVLSLTLRVQGRGWRRA